MGAANVRGQSRCLALSIGVLSDYQSNETFDAWVVRACGGMCRVPACMHAL